MFCFFCKLLNMLSAKLKSLIANATTNDNCFDNILIRVRFGRSIVINFTTVIGSKYCSYADDVVICAIQNSLDCIAKFVSQFVTCFLFIFFAFHVLLYSNTFVSASRCFQIRIYHTQWIRRGSKDIQWIANCENNLTGNLHQIIIVLYRSFWNLRKTIKSYTLLKCQFLN